MRKAALNELPKYSSWPARLLGFDEWQKRHKTPEEVTREYEYEKWGSLLDRVRKADHEINVDDVDKWLFEGVPEIFCSAGDEFEVMSPLEAHYYHLNLIERFLSLYLPASALVELGAGYGSIILSLAKRKLFSSMQILAAEYTNSGIELIRHLAKSQQLEINVAKCDFYLKPLTDLPIPKGSIIFTSYATHYVPKLAVGFVESLIKYNPKIVVHFEPCYEHCDLNTLIGLLRRRYIEVNDYNTNLATLLHKQQEAGMIKILNEEHAIFGSNPLLPISIIAWLPQ